MTAFIEAEQVTFGYRCEGESVLAVDDLSMAIQPGQKIVVLGRNGSGKSTLAKLFTGLILPDTGRIKTGGIDTADDDQLFELRRKCGFVFQNPDNQIVGTTVEEDVAFGPENIGVPLPDLRSRVESALTTVGLLERREEAPANLSGGQKQKLAIAGILAMQPEGIILDEATSMLDPLSRRELLELLDRLVKVEGLTAVHITHHMDEALDADQLFILAGGRPVLAGSPAAVLSQTDRIRELGLEAPFHLDFCAALARLADRDLPTGCVSTEGAIAFAVGCLDEGSGGNFASKLAKQTSLKGKVADGPGEPDMARAAADSPLATEISADPVPRAARGTAEPILTVSNLSYAYAESDRERPALKDVSFAVNRGECFGIMGQTGSGKSTLVQHFNALIRPPAGAVRVFDLDAGDKKQVKELRRRVGLLFQYPEHQLFAETCYEDIAFGPRQIPLPESEVKERVHTAAAAVGLAAELLERSPFTLSGGQKRRVALAGVLALQPDILVLDEPAAGLDPVGRSEIFRYISSLKEQGVTIILVSHDMTELARLTDRLLLLEGGEVVAVGSPKDLFSREDLLKRSRLEVPEPVRFLKQLAKYFPAVDPFCLSPETAATNLWAAATADREEVWQ